MCYTNGVYPFYLAFKEVIPLKYWRGYIAAALFAAIVVGLQAFADAHRVLVDLLYPYVTRLVQSTLADWSSGVSFCLWQVLVLVAVMLLLASIVAMVLLKWNFFQWLGWVLASCSLVFLLHTGLYGLNQYAGRLTEDEQHIGLADDIRLEVTDFQTTELVEATRYFRDQANLLAEQLHRNPTGQAQWPTFEEMANQAGDGFQRLTKEKSFSVFAGSTLPVKELSWADLFSSMGINGVTMPLTGEAAVNPNIPKVALPFTMCHEMAHRMCIAVEQDANLAAYLACIENADPVFRYSGYFMAYLYCRDALLNIGTSAAKKAAAELHDGRSDLFKADMNEYYGIYAQNIDPNANKVATTVNDSYIKVSGDDRGTQSYDEVTVLLVSWHIQEIYLPAHQEEEQVFDPLDKNQVDISGLPGAGK